MNDIERINELELILNDVRKMVPQPDRTDQIVGKALFDLQNSMAISIYLLVMPLETFQVGFTEDSVIKGTINDFLKII